MTASSYYNGNLAPWSGRINHRWSWSARQRNSRQWLQIYFGVSTAIRGISTQGRQDANQWVKSYAVSYSTNGLKFAFFKEGRGAKVRLQWSSLFCQLICVVLSCPRRCVQISEMYQPWIYEGAVTRRAFRGGHFHFGEPIDLLIQ